MVTMSIDWTEIFRPYQQIAYDKLVKLLRAPLIGPMGSGKTLVVMGVLDTVYGESDRRREPVVIICPYNAIPTWINHITKWLNVPREEIGIAQGSPAAKRVDIWHNRHRYQFIITTYASHYRDAPHYIMRNLPTILDEPHRYIRKRSETWKRLCSWTLHSPIVIPVDGTPMRHGPQDFFPYLKLCNKKRFSSYWAYVNTWCHVVDGFFGKEIVGPKNMSNFKKYIYLGYCAFMSEEEVAPYLPEKNRIFIPIEPTKFQRKTIRELYEQLYVELNDETVMLAPNVMTRIMRERQILVTPKILNPEWEYGAGLEALSERLEQLEQPRPVIFTPFTKALPYIHEYLNGNKQFKGRKIHTLRGGTKANELDATVKEFTNSEDDIMTCSTSFAESFEFYTSGTAFHLGFDWSADVQDQAEDRLRRLISEYNHVTNYYFQHINTVDGDVLEVVRAKKRNVDLVTPKMVRQMVEEHIESV